MKQQFTRIDGLNTAEFADTIAAYANLPNVLEIRLAITRRYVEGDEIPNGSCNLTVNSPTLYATVLITLPGWADAFVIIFDYPGLTMRRAPRDAEIIGLVARLHASPLSSARKIFYTTQPIEATNAMTPEQAAKTMINSDFAELNPATEADFYQRLGSHIR